MDNIGKPEVVTQKRVIDFFVNKLRYNYIGNLKDHENSTPTKQCTKLNEHCAPYYPMQRSNDSSTITMPAQIT